MNEEEQIENKVLGVSSKVWPWIFLVAAVVLVVIIAIMNYKAPAPAINGKIDNLTVFNKTLNQTQIKQISNVTLQDISAEMCAGLDNASRAANVTTTKYFMSGQYCVWEVKGYNQEYYVHCENAERKAEILIRPINMTLEVVEARFPDCKVLPVTRK